MEYYNKVDKAIADYIVIALYKKGIKVNPYCLYELLFLLNYFSIDKYDIVMVGSDFKFLNTNRTFVIADDLDIFYIGWGGLPICSHTLSLFFTEHLLSNTIKNIVNDFIDSIEKDWVKSKSKYNMFFLTFIHDIYKEVLNDFYVYTGVVNFHTLYNKIKQSIKLNKRRIYGE